MGNFSIHAGLVNGDLMPIVNENLSSDEIVTGFTGDDTGAPPNSVTIKIKTDSGKQVEVVIPNSSASAYVTVDGSMI
ncbi:hypothetical protein [Hafnia paralvei]|uniref:hypothetical protein n=1 Tax=Hafnia paralvei TaxID=546367 RepID=UPI0024A89BBC|nr:hypothetical protein [Hafnia paralvei]